MVRVRMDNKWKYKYAEGIHLWNPTEDEIEGAKDDAYANGFKTVWVHKSEKVKV